MQPQQNRANKNSTQKVLCYTYTSKGIKQKQLMEAKRGN
jgi:hypothetical protein